MKKLLVVVAGFAGLVAVAFVVGLFFADRAETRSDRALQRFAVGARELSPVAEPNSAATRLEAVARPLGIDLRPRSRALANGIEFDSRLMRSMTRWLASHQERPTDAIDAPPAEVAQWLAEHSVAIDAVVDALTNGEVPRWQVETAATGVEAPIPNLLAHINLLRVLNVAALDRERRDDHAGAWKLQHAAWTLTDGLLDRPEMISTLVAMAGVRMSAAVQRKLEAPVPDWRADIERRAFTAEMLEAIRLEFSAITKRARAASPAELVGAGDEIHEVAAATMMSPAFRWGAAQSMRGAFEQLSSVRTGDPCAVAGAKINEAIQANTPRLARRFGKTFMPNLGSALGRAALADLAVEGTSKVLALKAARAADPGRAWPTAPAIEASRCEGERWVYAAGPGAGMTLRFSGSIPAPEKFQGPKVPLEYVAQ